MKEPASRHRTPLARAIRSLICLTLVTSGTFIAQNSGADTSQGDPVEVTHPWPDNPTPDPWPGTDDPHSGGSGGGGSGGDGGSGSNEPPAVSCQTLLLQKPAQCPNAIPMPSGADYARDQFQSGSGIAKLLYYRDQSATDPLARFNINAALEMHTELIAAGTHQLDQIQIPFFNLLSVACALQTKASDKYRIGLGLTVPERQCLEAMGRAQAEAAPIMSFAGYFSRWLDKEGINLSDIFPQTIINAFSPANSMTVKFNEVTKDATCSRWWTQVQQNQCPL